MIYSYNTLGFYTTKINRQYDNTGNQRVLHHFETNKIPSIQIIIDTEITKATYILFSENDANISSGNVLVENDTTSNGIDYSRLILKNATTSLKDDGFYYLEITYGANKIYSDIFCWQIDVSEYLKISATSTNVKIGQFILNLASFEYVVYLEAADANYEYEIEEQGIEKTYGNIPLFNSRNKINEFEITGYSKTLDFLAGLRILWSNGNITLKYKGDEFEVYDIENPSKSDTYNYSDIIVLTMKFKRKDYLQSINV